MVRALTGEVVISSDVVCISNGVPKPTYSRACNTFPCPDTLASWRLGNWSVCSVAETTSSTAAIGGGSQGASQSQAAPTCGTHFGTRNRTVECVSASGVVVSSTACAALASLSQQRAGGNSGSSGLIGTAFQPASSESCAVVLPACGCSESSEQSGCTGANM